MSSIQASKALEERSSLSFSAELTLGRPKITSVRRKGEIVSRATRGSRFEWISAARRAAEIHSSNSR